MISEWYHGRWSAGDPGSFFLGGQSQPGGKEAVILRHGGFCAVDHIVDKLFTVWHVDLWTIEVFGFLLIDKEQMVTALSAGYVDVFAHLNIAVGAKYKGSAVAPRC